MGMKIIPSAFSRIMIVAMSGLNYNSCFIYLDDLDPVPQNSAETKRLVAFANYYQPFIKNFAEIAQPLNNLSWN